MKRPFSQNKFIRRLIKNRLVPLHRISLACREQKRVGGTLAFHLRERGYVSEDDLNRAIAAVMGIPYVELIPEKIDREAVASIPAEILTEHLAVPMGREGEALLVALADPSDPRALNDLALFSKRKILPAVARREAITFVLDYFISAGGGEIVRAYRLSDYSPPSDIPYARLIEDITGASLVYFHLLEGWRRGVKEIHFESTASGLKVRYRSARGMEERALYPPIFRGICISRLKVVAGAGEGGEGRRFSMTLGGIKARLHLSFFPALAGTGALVSFEGSAEGDSGEIALLKSARTFSDFAAALRRGEGLFAVSGKGRGVPLLLAETVFREFVSPRLKAVALRKENHGGERDYLELAVEEDSDSGYARGLRAVARQNPDAVFLDFLDGPETLAQAVKLGLAGGAVLGKSDLGSAPDFLSFALDCGLPASLLASVLQAILVVRPVRLLCPDCRTEAPVGDEDRREHRFLASPGWEKLFRSAGCAACGGTGFQGTEWLSECVVFTPEQKDSLRRIKDPWGLRAEWEGMVEEGILRQAEELLRQGKIDLKEFDLLRS